MLTHLHIRDLAIISSLSLDLRGGLTVLTGETGAGKSILIDALGLALGERADTGMVRNGSDKAEITVSFDIASQPEVQAWLAETELDEADDCLIRRILSREGRSRAFINGRPVSLQQVEELGNLLVEIHGQHAHQSLLKRSQQGLLLDAYGGYLGLVESVAERYRAYHIKQEQLKSLSTAAADRLSRLELLRFQAGELEALKLADGELESLKQDQQRLGHLEQLTQGCAEVLHRLDETEPSARQLLVKAGDILGQLQALDESLHEPAAMLDNALIQLDETLSFLHDYQSGLDLDPNSLEEVEQRLQAIHDMARKYRVAPEELNERLAQIKGELALLDRSEETLAELQTQVAQERQAFLDQAAQLSKNRQEAAQRLGREISEAMQQLGMPGGRFQVELTQIEPDKANQNGLEQIEFMVSANPGMPLQPLSKVASGGELSRISLAIQVATTQYANTPTLVFDEVDVGIGGGVAEIVGRLLRKLGKTRQVFCVTHLPQVASQASHHLQVVKHTEQEQTHTQITPLDETTRIQEVARMLGGVEITPQTLAHAQEMVMRSAGEA